jgi:hypothetical protein
MRNRQALLRQYRSEQEKQAASNSGGFCLCFPTLAHYLNKTVLVAIPALFEDGACRPFTLLGAELHGLWLQSEELTRRLLPEDKLGLAVTTATAVFVPFAQIAGMMVAGASFKARNRSGRRPSVLRRAPESEEIAAVK